MQSNHIVCNQYFSLYMLYSRKEVWCTFRYITCRVELTGMLLLQDDGLSYYKNIYLCMLYLSLQYFHILFILKSMLRGVPVPTAWRVLGLRMEERPPDMEVSCEYIE
jgi:hypothetical protein